jgi:energy-coupling factor transport system ATP-binding protein
VREHDPTGIGLEGLVFRYPTGVEALAGVDLAIAPGEGVAIVGQNGSGKTTLVKHLIGLLRPRAGRVLLGGRDVSGVPVAELARVVGFVFQDPDSQLFHGRVADEVAFGPRNLGLTAALRERLTAQALAAVGLDDRAQTNPYDLDLSTRKLASLASVLAMDPAVLVLDEPTTGQDGPGMARVGAIVDAFRAAGRTVIAISHDMEFAARHFGRIVVMRQGRVVLDGPPRQVFAAPNRDLLRSTGLVPPPTAELAVLLGLEGVPLTPAELLEILARQS